MRLVDLAFLLASSRALPPPPPPLRPQLAFPFPDGNATTVVPTSVGRGAISALRKMMDEELRETERGEEEDESGEYESGEDDGEDEDESGEYERDESGEDESGEDDTKEDEDFEPGKECRIPHFWVI